MGRLLEFCKERTLRAVLSRMAHNYNKPSCTLYMEICVFRVMTSWRM